MQATCVPTEEALKGIPTIKRLWRARNTLAAKLSERRAKLKREGIISDTIGTDESSSDNDDDTSDLWVSLLSITCNHW
jgi:hypothetical protein